MTATWLRRAWLGLLLLGVGCGETAPALFTNEGEPEFGGTLVIAAAADLDMANPLLTGVRWSQEVNRSLLFLPLLRFDDELGFEPVLASAYRLEGDTAVVFDLRRDVFWHDGAPTTAWDVAFSFERAVDPETAFPNVAFFDHWEGVEVLDSFRVRFTYAPHADPLAGLPFFGIVPRHVLDSIPPARLRQAAFNKQPIGNGPFRFAEYRANDRWVFEANTDFAASLGGRPYLDRIVWRVIPETSAQLVELQTGTVDVMLDPRASEIRTLDADPRFRAIVRPSRNYAFIGWNGRRPPLDDARVRRALTMAIDRRQAIDALRAGYGEPAVGPIGPHHWSFDPGLDALPYDVEAARALMRQAGIEDRNGDGTLQLPDGQPFSIELKLPAQSAFNRDIAELVRRDLTALGVRFVTRPTEFGTMIGDVAPPDRNFDAVLLGWEADFRVNLRNLFHSDARDGLFGLAGYANPEVDSLIETTTRMTDRRQAGPLLQRLQQILRDEQPWAFLYYYPDLFIASERVRGMEMDVRGALTNAREWWIPRAQQGRGAAAAERSDSAGHVRPPEPAPR